MSLERDTFCIKKIYKKNHRKGGKKYFFLYRIFTEKPLFK